MKAIRKTQREWRRHPLQQQQGGAVTCATLNSIASLTGTVVSVTFTPPTITQAGGRTSVFFTAVCNGTQTNFEAGSSSTTLFHTTAPLTVRIPNLTPDTSYSVNLRMYDTHPTLSTSTLLCSTGSLTVKTGPPQPVVIPSATAINGTECKISWQSIPTATQYTITLRSVSGSIITAYTSSITGSTATITGLVGLTSYKFSILAKSSTGESSKESDVTTFTTGPPAPVLNAATAITTTTFSIPWAGTRDPYFVLDFTSSPSGPTTQTASGSNTSNPATFTGATANTIYSITATARMTGGTFTHLISPASTAVTITTLPAPPTGITSSNITTTGFTLSFTAPTGTATITSYQLKAGTTSIPFTRSGTSLTVTGYSPNQVFNNLTITATNAGGTSAPSTAISVTTNPPAPTTPTVLSSTNTSITFNPIVVGGVGGTTSIISYIFKNGTTVLATIPKSATPILTGLTGNTIYNITVSATNAGGTSAESTALSVTTKAAAPTGLTVTNITTTETDVMFTVSFAASPGNGTITTYTAIAVKDGVPYTTKSASASASPIPISGFEPATRYNVTVNATNAGGVSTSSSPISVTTKGAAPRLLDSSNRTDRTFSVSWTPLTGAAPTAYTFKNGTTELAATVSGSTASISGLSPNTLHSVRMTTTNAGGESLPSSPLSVTTVPGPPTGITSSNRTTTGCTLSFTAPAGTATILSYEVKNGTTVLSSSLSGTGLTVSGLTANTVYSSVTITATNAGGVSLPSTAISVTTVPATPTGLSVNNTTETAITLNAISHPGTEVITSYTFKNGTTLLGTIPKSATPTITGLSGNTAYSITVSATNAGGTSADSTALAVTTKPAAPTGLTVSNRITTETTVGCSISFTAPPGPGTITSYTVYTLKNGDPVSARRTSSASGTTASIVGLTANTVYSVRITAINAGGASVESTPISVTTLPMPPSAITITAGTITTTGCTLTITGGDSVAGVTTTRSYTLNGGTATSYVSPFTINTLTPGSSNTFIVSATNTGGTTTATRTVATPPVQPTGLSKAAVSGTGFTLNWAATNGSATTYSFYIGGTLTTPSVTGNSARFTNLNPNTSYSITMSATANGTTTSPSNALALVTGPAAPVLLPFTNISSSGFTVSWNGATGATNYSYLVNGTLATPVSTTANSVTFDGYSPGDLPVVINAINTAGTTPSAQATVRLPTPAEIQASSAVQQVASSAEQQAASSAVQQRSSSATQQQASSAVQQVASSAVQQVASSATQQQASSAQQQRASSAVQQVASSAVQQVASSAMQQQASSAEQQRASSAIEEVLSGKRSIHRNLIDELNVLRRRAVELNTIIYSSASEAEKATAIQQLKLKVAEILAKQREIFAESSTIRAINSRYEDRDMQVPVPDPEGESLGYTRWFDIQSNKYFYRDVNIARVPNSNVATRRASQQGGERNTQTQRNRHSQRGGAAPTPITTAGCSSGHTGCTSSWHGTITDYRNYSINIGGGVPATSWSAILNGNTITSQVSATATYISATINGTPGTGYRLSFINFPPNTLNTITQIKAFNGTLSTTYNCNISSRSFPSIPTATRTLQSDGTILIRIFTPDTNPSFVADTSVFAAGYNLNSQQWNTQLSPAPVAATDGGGGYTTTMSRNTTNSTLSEIYITAVNTGLAPFGNGSSVQKTGMLTNGYATVRISFPPAKPVISQSTCSSTNTTVTWPWVNSLTTYTYTVSGTNVTPVLGVGPNLPSTLQFNGLAAGSSPVITVTATQNGASTTSDPFTAITAPTVQAEAYITAITSTSITITWTGRAGVTYTPLIGPSSTTNTAQNDGTITGTGTLSYTKTGLTPDSQNIVQINSRNICGTRYGDFRKTTISYDVTKPTTIIANNFFTLPNPPSAITITAGTVTTTGCTLNIAGGTSSTRWPATKSYTLNGGGATSYVNSVVLSGLTPGSSNTFIASATNGGGTTTATRIVTTPPVQPTGLSKAAVSGTGFTLNWAATNGSATTYSFYIGGVLTVPSISGNSATFTNLNPNTSYSITMSATANGTASTPSNALPVVTGPAAPVLLPFTNITGSGFTISWGGAAGATNYSYLVNGVLATPVSITANSVTFDGYSAGGDVPVIINAINTAGTTPSAQATVRLPTLAELQASSAIQQVASSALQQVASSAQQQRSSSATQRQASSAVQQVASSAMQQVASSATQQAASSAVQQRSSSAMERQASSAVQQVASSAMQQVASSATQQAASSAQQQQASSAVQRQASSAVQQVASSAMQQVASSATQQAASSATQQQASSAVQQQASSAVQQVASSAMQQVASSAQQQQASSAVQQVASSAMQQVASSAQQQQASSAQRQRFGVSGATIFKRRLIDELNALRVRVSELLSIVYSPQTQYPFTTRDGVVLPTKENALHELTQIFFAFSRKQTEILTMDSFARQFDSSYEHDDMRPVISDARVAALGYTKRFDIASNKYIFFNQAGEKVAPPI
jgi:hypothetical protein